jgi:hypothetical protein
VCERTAGISLGMQMAGDEQGVRLAVHDNPRINGRPCALVPSHSSARGRLRKSTTLTTTPNQGQCAPEWPEDYQSKLQRPHSPLPADHCSSAASVGLFILGFRGGCRGHGRREIDTHLASFISQYISGDDRRSSPPLESVKIWSSSPGGLP